MHGKYTSHAVHASSSGNSGCYTCLSTDPDCSWANEVKLRQVAVITAGIVLIPIGCLTLVSPIPGGSLVLPAALATLIYESPYFRGCIQSARARMPRLNRWIMWGENRVGKRIGDVLKLTRPCVDSTVDDTQLGN
jgi:hypothetical protein